MNLAIAFVVVLMIASPAQDSPRHSHLASLEPSRAEELGQLLASRQSVTGLRSSEHVHVKLGDGNGGIRISETCLETLALSVGSVDSLTLRNVCVHRSLRLGPRLRVEGDIVLENVTAPALVLENIDCFGQIIVKNIAVETLFRIDDVGCGNIMISGLGSLSGDAALELRQLSCTGTCEILQSDIPSQQFVSISCTDMRLETDRAIDVAVQRSHIDGNLDVWHHAAGSRLSLHGTVVEGEVYLALGMVGRDATLDLGTFRGNWGDTIVDAGLVEAISRGTTDANLGPALRRVSQSLRGQGRTTEYLVVDEAVAWYDLQQASGLFASIGAWLRWFSSGQGKDVRILLCWAMLFSAGLTIHLLLAIAPMIRTLTFKGAGVALGNAVFSALVGVFPVRVDHFSPRRFDGLQLWVVVMSQLITWLLILLFVRSVLTAVP